MRLQILKQGSDRMLEIVLSGQFRKDYKLAKKRGYDFFKNELVLYLTRTGTHSDLF